MYTVMIAEDETIVKRSLAKMIQNHHRGFTVAGEADNGREALAQIERLRPDVLITDICMPVMDGLTLIQAIREKNLTLEPVIISGYGEFAYAQKAMQFGVNEYLLKPIRLETLDQTLERVFAKLESRSRRFTLHVEWLNRCREAAQKAVDCVLLFNESALEMELESVHRFILQFEAELAPYSLKHLYRDFITACNQELKERELYCRMETDLAGMTPERLPAEAFRALRQVMEELRSRKGLKPHYKIQQAIEMINERFTESLTLEEMAKEAGLTPPYFSRAFSEAVGMSFVQYVTQLRIKRAKMLLKQTHLKTYEIAEAVGYWNYPHFSRVFKRHVGCSPEAFRKDR